MNTYENTSCFKNGLRDGFPISMGYFAVAFTLGVAAKKAGFTPFSATLTSLLVNASAGEYAGFTLAAADASYVEMALMIFIANVRYLLMSCALSQKLKEDTSLLHRFLLSFDLTDEIFALSVSVPKHLNPWYSYGMMVIAMPGWALGTCLGVVMGNILPGNIVSALSVSLYGMFLAIIIPPTKTNPVLRLLIPLSMGSSYLFAKCSLFANLSSGSKIILLTVVLSALAAIFFPVSEEQEVSHDA